MAAVAATPLVLLQEVSLPSKPNDVPAKSTTVIVAEMPQTPPATVTVQPATEPAAKAGYRFVKVKMPDGTIKKVQRPIKKSADKAAAISSEPAQSDVAEKPPASKVLGAETVAPVTAAAPTATKSVETRPSEVVIVSVPAAAITAASTAIPKPTAQAAAPPAKSKWQDVSKGVGHMSLTKGIDHLSSAADNSLRVIDVVASTGARLDDALNGNLNAATKQATKPAAQSATKNAQAAPAAALGTVQVVLASGVPATVADISKSTTHKPTVDTSEPDTRRDSVAPASATQNKNDPNGQDGIEAGAVGAAAGGITGDEMYEDYESGDEIVEDDDGFVVDDYDPENDEIMDEDEFDDEDLEEYDPETDEIVEGSDAGDDVAAPDVIVAQADDDEDGFGSDDEDGKPDDGLDV